MKVVKIGIIGLGLMGKEISSAVSRWCHLPEMQFKPEICAVCDTNKDTWGWYLANFPSISQTATDYRELLDNPEIDIIYCAVPHMLHEKVYCDIISAGKSLLGEKPFGIDKIANDSIISCIKEHPDVFVRCTSEFPFYPAVQKIGAFIEEDRIGNILDVDIGLLHSSDMDPLKPINWKRRIKTNGEYGCMGDLGLHVCHMPMKAGWKIHNVRAILSDIVSLRPDPVNPDQMVDCDTWDNATLLCETTSGDGQPFPMTIKTQRIAPGKKKQLVYSY